VDGVLFAHADGDDSELAELAGRCRHLGLQVGEVPRLFLQLDQRVRGGHSGGVPLLLMDGRGPSGAAAAVARVLDCILAALVLVLAAPLWLAIAVAIVVDERGPVLYRARRVGQGGREFDMYKFRKMRSDAAGPRLTVSGDARFTRVGGFLARTKLDELPQLLNVLRGEMALVGPRPEDPSFVADFPGAFDAITRVRPGITGLSQIQYRDESALLVGDDFEALYRELLLPQKIALDLFYARHRCLALDLRVLAWTVVAIVTGATVRRDDLTCSVSFARANGTTLHEALRVDASAQPDALRDVA
jgi:lipopolysaccharide/colanic/teichoic acid biosynthesis glycosyltransferase